MIIINILFYGFMFRVLGGGFVQLPRYAALFIIALFTLIQVGFGLHLIALAYLFYIVRLLPTGNMFITITGSPPEYRNSPYSFLYRGTFWVWKKLPAKIQSWELWGIIYAFLRSSIAIPAMFIVGGYGFLAEGIVYYLAGRYAEQRQAVIISEIILGAYFGILI